VGNGIKGGTPSKPQFVSQYKYDLDKLYKRVELKGGPGFIRGTTRRGDTRITCSLPTKCSARGSVRRVVVNSRKRGDVCR